MLSWNINIKFLKSALNWVIGLVNDYFNVRVAVRFFAALSKFREIKSEHLNIDFVLNYFRSQI